jgi:hypothetical protein
MEENQNGMYGGDAPRTYGEDTKMYENQANGGAAQQTYGQPNGMPNQQYGQPNPQYTGQSYGQPNGMPNQQYGQPNGMPYQQPYMNGYGYQQQTPVKDIFCNILIVLMPLRMILAIVINVMAFSAMGDYTSVVNGSYMNELLNGPYMLLSNISNLLTVAYIILVILDIMNVHKGNYKITGLILFAIFLNPGYYIWRAHVLKRDKKFPIIYTVIYSLIMVANYVVTFYYAFNWMMDMITALPMQ